MLPKVLKKGELKRSDNEDAWLQMGNEMSLALKDDNNTKRKTQEKKGEKGGPRVWLCVRVL